MVDPEGYLEIDLTHFEEKQKRRYDDAATVDLNRLVPDDEVEVQRAPWEDERSFDELYGAESIWKARSLILDGRVEKVGDHYVVQGSQPYRVNILEGDQDVPWAVCSCPNGEKRGGRPSCYHSAAVLATVLNIDLSQRERPKKLGRS